MSAPVSTLKSCLNLSAVFNRRLLCSDESNLVFGKKDETARQVVCNMFVTPFPKAEIKFIRDVPT